MMALVRQCLNGRDDQVFSQEIYQSGERNVLANLSG